MGHTNPTELGDHDSDKHRADAIKDRYRAHPDVASAVVVRKGSKFEVKVTPKPGKAVPELK